MITPYQIYLITRLDPLLQYVFTPLIAAGAILSGICIVVALVNSCEDNGLTRKSLKVLIIFVFFLILGTFGNALIPTTKTAIAIYAIPKIANNESVQQIPANFAKLINVKLQEWMKDAGIEEVVDRNAP